MSEYHNNSIFWVETEKILPNPFQPRRDFDPAALEDLADSIRQYGVLQPLVVTRQESLRPDGAGMDVFYELIAGERRLRASKIAGLHQVPVIIRRESDNKVKLELAIIENLQREDLNPIDRALAFEQLHKEFGLTHVEIGKRMGKSRVYVSNSLRLLSLPQEIKEGLLANRITEGHTRPLLMLSDRPEEQNTLFKEIMLKKLSVRDAEKVARKIAQDRVRKKEFLVDPKIRNYEKQLADNLGTRVHIEPREQGGQILIDYLTLHELEDILQSIQKVEKKNNQFDYLNPSSLPATPHYEKATENLAQSNGLTFPIRENNTQSTNQKNQELDISEALLEEPKKRESEQLQNYYAPLSQNENFSSQSMPYQNTINTLEEQNYHKEEPYHQPILEELPYRDVPYHEPSSTQLNTYHHPISQHHPQHMNHYSPQQPTQPPQKKGFFGKLFG